MAGADRDCAGYRRTFADNRGAAGDGDRNSGAAPLSIGNGDAAASHSHCVANQYALAATEPVANSGTGDYRANGAADATDRYCRCRAFANRQRGGNAIANGRCTGNAFPNRSTGAGVSDSHGNRSAAAKDSADCTSATTDCRAASNAANACATGGADGSAATIVALLR